MNKSHVFFLIHKNTKLQDLKDFFDLNYDKNCIIQFETDYNPVHWHDGNISGVMYTKIPEDFGGSYKKYNRNGNIAFIHGSTQLTSSSVYTVKPELGDLFLFPSTSMFSLHLSINDKNIFLSIGFFDCLLPKIHSNSTFFDKIAVSTYCI